MPTGGSPSFWKLSPQLVFAALDADTCSPGSWASPSGTSTSARALQSAAAMCLRRRMTYIRLTCLSMPDGLRPVVALLLLYWRFFPDMRAAPAKTRPFLHGSRPYRVGIYMSQMIKGETVHAEQAALVRGFSCR